MDTGQVCRHNAPVPTGRAKRFCLRTWLTLGQLMLLMGLRVRAGRGEDSRGGGGTSPAHTHMSISSINK